MTHRKGFSAADIMMAKGESRIYEFGALTSRYEDLDSCALYTAGRFTLTDPFGKVIAERTPGTFTEDRPDSILAGSYTLTCHEDGSRWFCINSKTTFYCTKLQLDQDQVHTMPPEQLFFFCSGEMEFTQPTLLEPAKAKVGSFIGGDIGATVLRGIGPTSLGVLLWR